AVLSTNAQNNPPLSVLGLVDGDNADSSSASTRSSTRTSPTRATSASSRQTSSQREEDAGTVDETNTAEDNTDDEDKDGELSNEPEPTGDGGDSENDDDEDDEEPTPSFDESYEETGQAGAMSLTTPDVQAVGTPMFEIGEKIILGWDYSKSTLRPPKKISICGKFPRDSGKSKDRAAICDWDIAVNISASLKKFTWDTLTGGAPGVAFSQDTGYF
ncbi:hypothetical protein LPJ75_007169, partial [Coemansia sp. RSA 2598]